MEELLQNNTVTLDIAWDLIIRVAFVCFAVLYAVVTRNISDNISVVEKLDTIAIGLFIIGAFPVLLAIGIYKGINYLIKNRNEKRCFCLHTDGAITYSLKILQRGDEHLMLNKYEIIVEYSWDKQNGFCQKVTSVGYEKIIMAPKNNWEAIYREEYIESNLDDEMAHETEQSPI